MGTGNPGELLQRSTLQGRALETGTQLYVNQGTGFWGPPMRLGTRCEISLLTFQRALSQPAV